MKKIPSPKSLPFFGTMLSIVAAGGASKLHLYVDRRHRELGPIYREKIGPVSGVFVSDGNYMRKIFGAEGKYPKHIVPESWLLYNEKYKCKRGLLFMNDEEWLTFRKTLNGLMLKGHRDEFYNPVNLVAENFIQNWKKSEKVVNLERDLYKWSLEVIVAILIGCDNYVDSKKDVESTISQLSDTVHRVFVESANISLIPAKLAWKMNLPVWKRFVVAATSAVEQGKQLTEILLKIERKKPGNENLLTKMVNTGMKAEDLKRIVVDLILAAGDTTAHTMQWFLHLLSFNFNSQELIYNEIKKNSEEGSHRSPLLKGALKEALRLYPVAPFVTRFLPEDLILDGYRIKSEELVLMSLYSSGRNGKYFPEPDSFLPGRWSKKGQNYEGVNDPWASLPFAMGARSCVGRKIAETQILVTMSKILQNFAIKSENAKMVEIKLHLVSVPSEPIKIILERRKDQNSISKEF